MFDPRPRLLAAAAASALLLIPLTGCGGGDNTAETGTSAGADQSPASSTDLVEPTTFVEQALAAIDAKKTVHMEIAGGSFLTASADMAFGNNPSSMITASVFGGQQVIIVSEGVVYLQASEGAKFSVVDENTPTLGPLIDTFTSLGPKESIDGIRSAISSISEAGSKTIDGRDLTAYTVTVDTSQLAGALKLLAGTSGASAQLPMEFYLDADGLVRQIEFPITGEAVTITFTDWDKPVTVEKPTDVAKP